MSKTKIGERVEYIVIDSEDFDMLVNTVYPESDYNFVADIECGNDSQHAFNDIKEEEIHSYDQEKLEKLKVGQWDGGRWTARTILTDMVNKEILQPGNYLIDVSW